MKYAAYIFDLDGTLLDTLPDLVVHTNQALKDCGFPQRSREEILSYVGNGIKALMLQAVPLGTPEKAALAALDRWKALFEDFGNELTTPFPGVVETLEALQAQGARMAVLSNKFDRGTQEIIQQRLPGLFEVVHGECEGIPRKPDPTGLLRTISELGAQPHQAVYVGDSPGDVLTARNAGCAAVAITYGYHTPEEMRAVGADHVVDAFPQILHL
ncbi:MAG: HAD-IA family hydrolase [Coriobacteriia bacterium]|nr:HAD-IA family hydrolase [Coriobacteriia bacterium]